MIELPTVKIEQNIKGMLDNYCGEEKKQIYVVSRAVEEFLKKRNGIHHFKGGKIYE